MLLDAKLAGILLERSGERVVAGFGVNLVGAPPIEGRKTASLASLASLDPKGFARLIAPSFARVLDAWRDSDPAAFARAWMARAHPVGTPLNVHTGPGERVSGAFDGIEPDGALRLRTADGRIELVRAGDASFA
jgi:BirA family biotin operon repressor/biotin-[acetyl-CoA-carboxylase] ligase